MRPFWVAILLLASVSANAQSNDQAEKIYKSSQNSVFLVYLNDSSGNPDALGSAFLVAPGLLVTNAHVAEAGSPVLAVGPVRLPLKIVQIDQKNDLAILHVDTNLVSKPLSLSAQKPSPGEEIFALGNPEGLEKSISQGIIAGIRTVGDRQLIQITSPISHGSSGGPILDARGEVVGVAVGMLKNGQNLNFAVPVKYVHALLAAKSAPAPAPLDCSRSMAALKSLVKKRSGEQYSSDSSSQYQQDTQSIMRQAAALLNGCKQPLVLEQMACLGPGSVDLGDDGIKAARILVSIRPKPETHALLAYVLYEQAQWDGLLTIFAKDGSSEKIKEAKDELDLMSQAEHEADRVKKRASGNPLFVADFVLAGVKNNNKDFSSAIELNSAVASTGAIACSSDLAPLAYRSLVSESTKINNNDAAEKWFRKYASKYDPSPYEWDQEGDRRSEARDSQAAADAYERAAAGSTGYDYDYCYAAEERYFHVATGIPHTDADMDAVLSDGRKCTDASVKDTNGYSQKQFQRVMPEVYEGMADILNRRGVYKEALVDAKESLALKPNDAFVLETEAAIFENLEQFPECISAAHAAINASDGKYGFMHFQLGNCYFDAENWSEAANSFKLAADMNKSDAASAYNLGLSLARQGYSADAQQWFREALRRNPESTLREKILTALR